jgi:Protein of unknown function (DUF3460)
MYESDITRFLKALKQQRPQLEAEQRKGRAIFWDKVQDLDTNDRDRASNVAQQAYVYQTKE